MSQLNTYAYTRDDGSTVLSLRTRTYIAGASGLGFGSPSASNPAPPKGFRPRKVYLHDPATGRSRSEVVATPSAFATLVNTPGATVVLPELSGGTSGSPTGSFTTWHVTNGRGEGFSRGTGTPHLIH